MSENRKKYYRVKEIQKKMCNGESKLRFLKRCAIMKIVPNTLQVRNTAPQDISSEEATTRWHDAQLRGGLGLVREATVVQLQECRKCRSELRRAVTALEELAGPETWPDLEGRLDRDRRISYKTANNRTRQRLRLQRDLHRG